MNWLPACIAALIPLQLVSDWIARHRIVVAEGSVNGADYPRWWQRYVAWFTVREPVWPKWEPGERETMRMIRVRLPAWDWRFDYGRGVWCWHRALLVHRSRGASGERVELAGWNVWWTAEDWIW